MIQEIIAALAVLLIVVGAGMIYIPASLIVGGFVLLLIARQMERDKKKA